MYCMNCGTFLNDGAKFCPNCGSPVGSSVPTTPRPSNNQQPVQQYQQPVQQYQQRPYQQPVQQQRPYQQPYIEKKNKIGLAGFIFSIISLFTSFLYGITSLLGLIFSIVGMAKKKKCNKWNGFATAGFIINLITLIYGILIIVLAGSFLISCAGML